MQVTNTPHHAPGASIPSTSADSSPLGNARSSAINVADTATSAQRRVRRQGCFEWRKLHSGPQQDIFNFAVRDVLRYGDASQLAAIRLVDKQFQRGIDESLLRATQERAHRDESRYLWEHGRAGWRNAQPAVEQFRAEARYLARSTGAVDVDLNELTEVNRTALLQELGDVTTLRYLRLAADDLPEDTDAVLDLIEHHAQHNGECEIDLSLSQMELTHEEITSLAQLNVVTRLNISNGDLNAALGDLIQSPRLNELSVLADDESLRFRNYPQQAAMSSVQRLDVVSADLLEDDVKAIATMPVLQSLRVFENDDFTLDGMRALAAHPRLNELILDRVECNAESIGELSKNTLITSLGLIECHLNDEHVAALQNMSRLVELDVSKNQGITDQSASMFARLPALKTLNLANTGVSFEGLLKQTESRSLETVRVSPHGLSLYQREQLAQIERPKFTFSLGLNAA